MFKSPWLNISLLHLVKFYYRKSLCGITEESWRNRMSDPSRLQSFRPVEWWLSPWWICVVVVGGIDTVGVCTKEASMKENWDSWCRLSDFVLTTKKPERFFGAIELIYYWKLQQKSTKIDETQDSKALHPKVVDKADFWSHGASPIRRLDSSPDRWWNFHLVLVLLRMEAYVFFFVFLLTFGSEQAKVIQ